MRAVAGEHRGDRLADAAGRPRDERDLAVKRTLPVDRVSRRGARTDPDDLRGDVRRLGREEEAKRGLDLVLGAGLDVDQLRGRSAPGFLADRSAQTLERALRDRGLRRVAALGRSTEQDHATAGA